MQSLKGSATVKLLVRFYFGAADMQTAKEGQDAAK
jgi:hypothetical protein